MRGNRVGWGVRGREKSKLDCVQVSAVVPSDDGGSGNDAKSSSMSIRVTAAKRCRMQKEKRKKQTNSEMFLYCTN